MRLFKLLLVSATLGLLPRSSFAHPVAYEGAISLMGFTSEKEQDFFALYSWSPHFATGFRQLQYGFAEGPRKFSLVQTNFLLKRWNKRESQGNLYFGGGAGLEKNAKMAALVSLDADWESRRVYASGQFQTLGFSRNSAIQSMKVRAGFAPYLAEYNELHSWFILEASRTPRMERKTEITPLIRIFYRNILTEFGRSLSGNFQFNFMAHY